MPDDQSYDLPDDDASRDLRAAMARLESRIADLDAEDDDEPDAETRTLLHALCAADTAPLEWKSILGRVERGTLTWEHFWRHPREEGSAGVALVREALSASTQDMMRSFAAIQDEFLERADAYNRERFKRGPGDRPAGPGGSAGGR